MSIYKNSGPIDCTVGIDAANLNGKTAIVTGAASGIGEAYVRALVNAGAHAIIADINEDVGNKFQQELSSSTTFAKCDVTSWASQLSVFKKAKEVSKTSRIDIVVANAGIGASDDIISDDLSGDEPKEPKMSTFDVNAVGVLLTTKLALWCFRKQNADGPRQDQCLVLQSSLAGYLDLSGAPQYTTSKFAVRGLMRSLRQTEQAHGIRVNLIAPWYIKTPIITGPARTAVEESGAGFAEVDDAAQALLRIVSDSSVHGRAIAILPRDWEGAPNGYVDIDQDDFSEDKNPWMHTLQEGALKPANWTASQ